MRERMGLGIGVALVSSTLLVVTLMYTAAALSAGAWRPWDTPPDAVRWDEVAKISLPAAALIAAVVGAVIAAYGHQARRDELALSRDSDVTDRYTRAVEQLGNAEQLAVRLGGIYALERIHHDSERDQESIEYLLGTYAATNAERRRGPAEEDPTIPDLPPRGDVEAALQTLGRLRTPNVQLNELSLVSIDLTRAQLPDCGLRAAILTNAKLDDSILTGANLDDADLTGARLLRANLTGAVLDSANLSGAYLAYANLTDAYLTGANLTGANLAYANLTGAKLPFADLARATLTHANLTGADLTHANLTGAALIFVNLSGADLTHANLAGANLARANLSGADLTDADLTGAEQLDDAVWGPTHPPKTNWFPLLALITKRVREAGGQ